MATDNDGIPQSVMDEVNAIRDGEAAPEAAEPEETERVQVSRKERKRQADAEREERETKILAAAERAAEAASKAAEERAADREKMARLEALLEAQVMGQRTQVQQSQPEPEAKADDYADRIDKHRKRGAEALAQNDLAEYQRRQEKIMEIKVEQATARLPRPQAQPQQQWQKPAWIQAVESQYPEVMMHPSGLNTVAAFAQMDQSPVSPEKLKKAFDRAKEELGLKPKENIQEKRQMLSGGPTRSTAKGSGAAGGKGEYLNLPKDWRAVAKRYQMTEAQYLRSYADSYPDEVERG